MKQNPKQLPSQKFKQAQSRMPSRKIIPLGFVLKFDPPILGLLYKRSPNEKKKKIYQIHLKNLIFNDDEVEITRQLFYEHPNYLDPDLIEPEQVVQLVQKLLEYKELKMQEMAQFLEECENQDPSQSNAFIYKGEGEEEEVTDHDTESQYLEELSQFDENVDLNDEETYKLFKLQEMERLKLQEKMKMQPTSNKIQNASNNFNKKK